MKSLYILVLILFLLAFILGFFIPEIQSFGIQLSFNTLLVLDGFFKFSGTLNPLIAWTIAFAVFGFFIGLIQSVKKNRLSKWLFIISFFGIAYLFWHLYNSSKPFSFNSSREIREKSLYEKIKTQNSFYQSSKYLNEFPEGKYIKEVSEIMEIALWDSANKVNTYEVWSLYINTFCQKTPNEIHCRNAYRNFDRLFWDQTRKKNNKEAFDKYLEVCPDGKFVADARRKLEKFNGTPTSIVDNNTKDSQPDENIAYENSTLIPEENRTLDSDPNTASQTGLLSVNNSDAETKQPDTNNGSLSLDGREYFGEIKNDKPHGNGKETFPDKSVLKGNYIDGKREGEFTYTDASGHMKRQIFNNGTKIDEFENGEATINGIKYRGELRNGLAHGKGKEFFPDNSILDGSYKEGKRDGVFTLIKSNGERETQIFKDGNRTN